MAVLVSNYCPLMGRKVLHSLTSNVAKHSIDEILLAVSLLPVIIIQNKYPFQGSAAKCAS